MRIQPLTVWFFIILPFVSWGQERQLLGGILINMQNGASVQSAHVMNLTDSVATISSEDGAFRIPVHLGDSLVITSIGYYNKTVPITEEALQVDYVTVRMVFRSYELDEVDVNPFGTKAQFREKFMNLEVDDGTIDIVGIDRPSPTRRTIPITEDKNEIKKAKYIFNPASFLYGNFSKDAQKRQELHRLERIKEKHRYNYTKFNDKVVSHITGYEGAELHDFMDYCNFSEDDIYRFSAYELTVAILNKQRTFERFRLNEGNP